MSDAPSSAPALDLERAAFEQPSERGWMHCTFCQRELLSSYFDLNGKPACEDCRYRVEQELHRGAGTSGFLKALAAGGAAAFAGFLLYWLIAELTGYALGIIAIVVGVMVGRAVRWGSRHRGGWVYQTMAILLTYMAISSTYIPRLFKQMQAERAAPPAASGPATAGAESATVATPQAEQPTDAPATAAATAAAPEPREEMSAGDFVVGIGSLLLLAAALPFLAGFQNILGILILGIGVYEAWKVNRRPKLSITGPLRVGAAPGAAAAEP